MSVTLHSQHRWIFYDEGDHARYEKVDYTPSPKSSRIQCEVLTGKSFKKAVQYLKKVWNHVADFPSSGIIICKERK